MISPVWKQVNQSLKDHFHIYSREIQKYLPQFEYILIDIARFDEILLEQFNDSISWFFMLDKTDIHNRGLAADRIITILRKLKQSDPEIFNLLGRYISGLLNYKGVEINKINEYFSLSKLIIPLKQAYEVFKEMHDEGIEKGKVQGIVQGIEQGKLIDKQDTLIRLLNKKFGISTENQELIKAEKNPEILADALDIILFANTIDEVLSPLKK